MAIQSKLPVLPALKDVLGGRHYVDVREAGAEGDGKADDGPAIQAAIDGLPQRTGNALLYGGTVYLPTGAYRVKQTLMLPERVCLLGEHVSRVRVMATRGFRGPVLRVAGDFARVENCEIRGGRIGVHWQGGIGATCVNARLSASVQPLRLDPGCRGMFHNLVVRGGEFGVEADHPGQVAFNGLSIAGTRRGGLTTGGGLLSVQAYTYDGPERALSAHTGARVLVTGASASHGHGEDAFYCAGDSLLHAAALSAPGYRLTLLDESGAQARLAGPTVGLYTGQATVLAGGKTDKVEPLRQVRVNCGGYAAGDFAADFGFNSGAMAYGNEFSDQKVDLARIKEGAALRQVYLTERSSRQVEYTFSMQPGRYRVRLHLCEIYFTKPGQRVFRIAVNDRVAAERVDLLATAGAMFTPVVVETAGVEPRNGEIVIDMTGLESRSPDGTAGNGSATVSAIEILPMKEESR